MIFIRQGEKAPIIYSLLDARQHREQYKELFCRYCLELSESDLTIGEYEPNELAEENLQSSVDHPYLIMVGEETAGLVVFMEEESPRDKKSCYSYLGELFVKNAFRNRGIASAVAYDFFSSQSHDSGLCYVRNSAAEDFWLKLMEKLGYEYEIFEEDEIRDFMHIHLYREKS